MGLYSLWKRRAYIRITSPVATAGYQHRLNLTWKLGMRDDFRDLRFTQKNGKNCQYWIESYTLRTSATVWINIPDASQTGLFMYYGNGQAASKSNGTLTFEFFDDFSGASVDASKWTATGSCTQSGGTMDLLRTGGNAATLASVYTAPTNVAIRSRMKTAHSASGTYTEYFGVIVDWNNGYLLYWDANSGGWGNKQRSAVSGAQTYNTISGWSANTWKTVEVLRRSTTSINCSIDGTEQTAITTNVYSSTRLFYFSVDNTNGAEIWLDWVVVRKLAATEPTLAVVSYGKNLVGNAAIITEANALYAGTEYAFDPVNIDHGMSAGVEAQEIEVTNGIAHGMTASVGVTEMEMGPVNIYHPMYPTASWAQIIDPVADSGNLISVTVSQSMDDAMAEAVFEWDGNEMGNYFSGDYMTQVHVNIPDYNGVSRCVFVGIVPSSHAVYDVAKDKMTMRAVDYGIFLTKQTLDIKDLSLLPPDDQTTEGANVAKVLSFDGRIKYFQIGMNVRGEVSGATGTVHEVITTSVQRLTLYPATGAFVDDEPLLVGGVTYAYADGRSVDVPFTPYYQETMPEDWVRSILGGANWMRVTGIEPTYIEDSGGYWDTDACPAVPFMFGSLEKKRDALKRLEQYMSYKWHVKPRSLGGNVYRAGGYFIKDTSIDTYLDLPAAATITGPDDFIAPVTLDQDGEFQVDVVRVRCQDLKGDWLEAIRSNSFFDAGEGPYREFSDEPKDICTQIDLNEYATDMYNLHSARTCSWSGTMAARSDLQLYQLLNISGLGIEIPDGTYRIIKILHEHGCAKNLTHITFMLSSAFSILQKYGMTYKDSISKVEQIVDSLETKKFQQELATVMATDGWTITYETEAGNMGKGRDSTSTPSTAGGIPVGAKISVQESRGGIICLPILPASGGSTDTLVVDVPVITQAAADPLDANYWYLSWTPGTNNQNVSVNYQTVSYPSAPGVVVSHVVDETGILQPDCKTKLFPISTTRVRIRFSGPNTTYYIKLWGEKNGNYSSTGATATITSGSGVTVPGGAEEPEPIVVIDQQLTAQWEVISDYVPNTREVYNHVLPFPYNGSDNIYIGGPVDWNESDDSEDMWWPDQPTDRYFWYDDQMKITGPKGSTTIYGASWHAPVNISGLLNAGVNVIKIETTDTVFGATGNSALYVRSYYL